MISLINKNKDEKRSARQPKKEWIFFFFLLSLFYDRYSRIEIKKLVWERLIFQRVMPPFLHVVYESSELHQFNQQLSIAYLFFSQVGILCPGYFIKTIESWSHINGVVWESTLWKAGLKFITRLVGWLGIGR